jgi:hypothetical protein
MTGLTSEIGLSEPAHARIGEYEPWVLSRVAPAWVGRAIRAEEWSERDVASLLKRLVAEDVHRIRFRVARDGVATVELESDTGEWFTGETLQDLDPAEVRPFERGLRRALERIARSRRRVAAVA